MGSGCARVHVCICTCFVIVANSLVTARLVTMFVYNLVRTQSGLPYCKYEASVLVKSTWMCAGVV